MMSENLLEEYYKKSVAYRDRLKEHTGENFRTYLGTIQKFAPDSACILEIGCGSGFSSFIISREGYKVIGSDPSHLFLDKSYQQKGRENHQFVVSNATKRSWG